MPTLSGPWRRSLRFTVSCLGQVSSWEMFLWQGEYRTPGPESPPWAPLMSLPAASWAYKTGLAFSQI